MIGWFMMLEETNLGDHIIVFNIYVIVQSDGLCKRQVRRITPLAG